MARENKTSTSSLSELSKTMAHENKTSTISLMSELSPENTSTTNTTRPLGNRSSSVGSISSALDVSYSPSPPPPDPANIFLDSDLPSAELRDSQFHGVVVGVCAMSKKSMSAPMTNILTRMSYNSYIRVVIFTDRTIIHKTVQEWPYCDALIAFYSEGFPLEKAIEYVNVRKPKLVINDLEQQFSLQDRRRVYETLQQHGVDVPHHSVLLCSKHGTQGKLQEEDSETTECGSHPPPALLETDDTIEVNGQVFHKPFVEKPVSAEDHNIYIYFPSDYGGGSQRLFRKVKDRSSSYHKESRVRNECCYIYEEFMATDGTDVKVYTVGPDYAHAEARKSPALDGRVERDGLGKEKRYPVILSAKEKNIARTVSIAFKQTVCGFDMLRSNGKSYVCDVNGFSFVKNSQKYYDDCAQILLETIMHKVAPTLPRSRSVEIPPEVPQIVEPTGNKLELRCVIGVIRHGDRTPKQKMKMLVTHPDFFNLFTDLKGFRKGHLKIKKPKDLQKVLDITRKLLLNVERDEHYEIEEKVHKLHQLKNVLEMYGYFSGINRKVQFRLLHRGMDGTPFPSPRLLLILKWGGELTPAGQLHAEELGRAFRLMYPGGAGEYASLPGSGFLRLHSTYRHDLKVYASDEGRVQMTAAAFTKGLLDLEGNLASILVHLVKRDENATEMLDTSTDSVEALDKVKQRLHQHLQSTEDFNEDTIEQLAPTRAAAQVKAIQSITNPWLACQNLHKHIIALFDELQNMISPGPLYHDETIKLMVNRWAKLKKDFKLRNNKFDISKIPDIYDCIKYDLLHNQQRLQLKNAEPLYSTVRNLADIVIPQEYGLQCEEKLDISQRICRYLLRKIRSDLHHTLTDEESDIIHRLDPHYSRGVFSPRRHVRTRLYFTSESHIHSLINILCYGTLMEDSSDPQWKETHSRILSNPEWNYLTQIVFLFFEDFSQPIESPDRYIIKVSISPGVQSRELISKPHRQNPQFVPWHAKPDKTRKVGGEGYHQPNLTSSGTRSSLPLLKTRAPKSSLLPQREEDEEVQSLNGSQPVDNLLSGNEEEDIGDSSDEDDRTKRRSELRSLSESSISGDSSMKRDVMTALKRPSSEGEEDYDYAYAHQSQKLSLDISAYHTPPFPKAISPLFSACTVPLDKMDRFLASMGADPSLISHSVSPMSESLSEGTSASS